MDPGQLLKCIRLIEKIPLEYMVSGSIAAILYGKPRLTHDMDVVVSFPQTSIQKFVQIFDTKEFYCPPSEVLEEEIKRGDDGQFNIIDQTTGFKIDVYPFKSDPLIVWGFERRKKIELLEDEAIWVAPPEYVILKKLAYYKEGGSDKHLEDIRSILEVSREDVDQKEIERWVERLDFTVFWQKA